MPRLGLMTKLDSRSKRYLSTYSRRSDKDYCAGTGLAGGQGECWSCGGNTADQHRAGVPYRGHWSRAVRRPDQRRPARETPQPATRKDSRTADVNDNPLGKRTPQTTGVRVQGAESEPLHTQHSRRTRQFSVTRGHKNWNRAQVGFSRSEDEDQSRSEVDLGPQANLLAEVAQPRNHRSE